MWKTISKIKNKPLAPSNRPTIHRYLLDEQNGLFFGKKSILNF
jgi:hypothetical protein